MRLHRFSRTKPISISHQSFQEFPGGVSSGEFPLPGIFPGTVLRGTMPLGGLAAFISERTSEDDLLGIVAHSHGGNVASLYTYESGARMVNFLITLGMPMVGIEPRRGSVGTWLNVYSGNDWIQTFGGFSPRSFWSSRAVTVVTNWLSGGSWGALSLVSSFIPVGRAGRTNRCAINIGIDTIGGAAVGHGDLTSGAVWNSMLG